MIADYLHHIASVVRCEQVIYEEIWESPFERSLEWLKTLDAANRARVRDLPSDVVYVLGAGVNQAVRSFRDRTLSPPLSRGLFRVAFRLPAEAHGFDTREGPRDLLDYVQRYWHLSRDDLRDRDFDLEECFTLLELQILEANRNGEEATLLRLSRVRAALLFLVARVLGESAFLIHGGPMAAFGELLWHEHPTVITFNYDTLVEQAIEHSARPGLESGQAIGDLPRDEMGGFAPLRDEHLALTMRGWNRPLGYGFKFDLVHLDIPQDRRFATRREFYALPDNEPYPWGLLKLHGSLNWLEYVPPGIHRVRYPGDSYPDGIAPELLERVIYNNVSLWHEELPDLDNWLLQPIIVPPVLYKEQALTDVAGRVLRPLWARATGALSACRRLVIIGYSFPATDFATKKMFLEAFADHSPEEVVIVDPDREGKVTKLVSELTNCRCEPTRFSDLPGFLSSVGFRQVPFSPLGG